MDDFTLAYGLILLVQGVGSLVGPPLAGLIFDLTDRWVSSWKIWTLTTSSFIFRWDDSFYAGGIFISLSGFLAYIIGELRVEGETDGDDDEMNNNDDMDERSKIAQRI